MALVVEDGTGKADAESYETVANAVAYASARGLTFPDPGVDAAALASAEAALRRATVWVDSTYRGRFVGWRASGRTQALEWPRTSAYMTIYPHTVIEADEIPHELKHAVIEAAVRELASPGGLSPDVVPGKIIKSVAVAGAVSVDYALPGTVSDQKPVSTLIDGILAPILTASNGGLFGSSSRS